MIKINLIFDTVLKLLNLLIILVNDDFARATNCGISWASIEGLLLKGLVSKKNLSIKPQKGIPSEQLRNRLRINKLIPVEVKIFGYRSK
jgi:hypothetical protein